MKDSEIVELYWQRDEAAIKRTAEKYEKSLSKISYNILASSEDCRECVNDTYMAAWNSMPEHRPANLATYLGKIIRQISIDRFRKYKSKKRISSEYTLSISEMADCIADNNTPEQIADFRLLDKAINSFLRSVQESERNIFIGRYYYFDSIKSIAEYTGLSESNVKITLFRIRQKLKDYLIREGFDV